MRTANCELLFYIFMLILCCWLVGISCLNSKGVLVYELIISLGGLNLFCTAVQPSIGAKWMWCKIVLGIFEISGTTKTCSGVVFWFLLSPFPLISWTLHLYHMSCLTDGSVVWVSSDACWDTVLSEVYCSVAIPPLVKPSVQEAIVMPVALIRMSFNRGQGTQQETSKMWELPLSD